MHVSSVWVYRVGVRLLPNVCLKCMRKNGLHMFVFFISHVLCCFLSQILVFIQIIDKDVCAYVNIKQHADVLLQ